MSSKQYHLEGQSHIKQCGHKADYMQSVKCSMPSEDTCKHAECSQHENEEELSSPGERVTGSSW